MCVFFRRDMKEFGAIKPLEIWFAIVKIKEMNHFIEQLCTRG
jgi:hypothetical protein